MFRKRLTSAACGAMAAAALSGVGVGEAEARPFDGHIYRASEPGETLRADLIDRYNYTMVTLEVVVSGGEVILDSSCCDPLDPFSCADNGRLANALIPVLLSPLMENRFLVLHFEHRDCFPEVRVWGTAERNTLASRVNTALLATGLTWDAVMTPGDVAANGGWPSYNELVASGKRLALIVDEPGTAGVLFGETSSQGALGGLGLVTTPGGNPTFPNGSASPVPGDGYLWRSKIENSLNTLLSLTPTVGNFGWNFLYVQTTGCDICPGSAWVSDDVHLEAGFYPPRPMYVNANFVNSEAYGTFERPHRFLNLAQQHLARTSPRIEEPHPVVLSPGVHPSPIGGFTEPMRLTADGGPVRLTAPVGGIEQAMLAEEDAGDAPTTAADLDANGVVDGRDVALVLASFGREPNDAAFAGADVNADGVIDSRDLLSVLTASDQP